MSDAQHPLSKSQHEAKHSSASAEEVLALPEEQLGVVAVAARPKGGPLPEHSYIAFARYWVGRAALEAGQHCNARLATVDVGPDILPSLR